MGWVRAQADLPDYFGGCLAMTVLESKGLEFDDVFLWNFFKDSRAEAEWRLALSYLAHEDEGEARMLEEERRRARDCAGSLRTLEFDEHAHQLFCEELKHLYTAITRARVRVIIYDEDVRRRAPMFYYLQRRQLVQTLSVFAADAHVSFASRTGREDWFKQVPLPLLRLVGRAGRRAGGRVCVGVGARGRGRVGGRVGGRVRVCCV